MTGIKVGNSICALLAGLLFCALVAGAERSVDAWEEIFSGVWYAEGLAESPRLQRAFAIRVDLENPDVRFLATPGNGGDPGHTARQTTPAFLEEHGLAAAINANFFRWAPGNNAIVEGLLVSNGEVITSGDAEGTVRRGQLRIAPDNTAAIVDWVNAPPPDGVHTGIAGSAFPLLSGTPLGDDSGLEPRTGVGISQNGRYLILLVIDGRRPGHSQGASIRDIGVWLKEFGAWHGIDLDGGGSSTLVTAGEGVRNRPSDGAPREVGVNFGVFAAPLESEERGEARLKFQRNGHEIVLTWDDPGAQLQVAETAFGPWWPMSNASSPFTVNASLAARRFFRLCLEDCPPRRQ